MRGLGEVTQYTVLSHTEVKDGDITVSMRNALIPHQRNCLHDNIKAGKQTTPATDEKSHR